MITKIKDFDVLTEKLNEAKAKMNKKRGTIEGTDKMVQIKRILAVIKNELFKLEQRIGILRTTLIRQHEVEYDQKNLHHLYDDVEDDFELK